MSCRPSENVDRTEYFARTFQVLQLCGNRDYGPLAGPGIQSACLDRPSTYGCSKDCFFPVSQVGNLPSFAPLERELFALLQFGLPATWTRAKERGATLEDIARWWSSKPAKLANLRRKVSKHDGKYAGFSGTCDHVRLSFIHNRFV